MNQKQQKRAMTKYINKIEIPDVLKVYMEKLDEPCGLKDTESTFVFANKAYHDLLNLPSSFNVIGRKDHEMPASTSEYAGLFQAHDRLVESTGKRRSSLEIHPFGKDQQLSAYFFDKTPFPDMNGTTVGTFFHGRKAEHLSLQLDISDREPESLLLTTPSQFFSEAEWLIIFYIRSYLCRKEISRKLNLSEGYVKNKIAIIYEKAGVSDSRMLIDFIRSHGWHRYVPEQLLTHNHRVLA